MSEINVQQKLISEFNNYVGMLKAQIQNKGQKNALSQISKSQTKCKELLEQIQNRFRTIKFPVQDRIRTQKLAKDFQQIALEYQRQCDIFLSIKKQEFDEIQASYKNSLRGGRINNDSEEEEDYSENSDCESSTSHSYTQDSFKETPVMKGKRMKKKMKIDLQPEIEIQYQIQLEKNQELKNVAQEIHSIAHNVNEIGRIVQEQGKQIDEIAENISETKQNVIKSNKELGDAKVLHKDTKKKKCCIMLVGIGIILVILIPILVL